MSVPNYYPLTQTTTFHICSCMRCGNGDMVMPFGTWSDRNEWMEKHYKGTGHGLFALDSITKNIEVQVRVEDASD